MSEDESGDDASGRAEDDPSSHVDVRERHPVPVDSLLQLLGNRRRRTLLAFLARRAEETVGVDDVVDALVARERPEPGPGTHRERVAIDLHHVHIPKLAEAGVVEYDPLEGTLRYRDRDGVELLLAAARTVAGEEERDTRR